MTNGEYYDTIYSVNNKNGYDGEDPGRCIHREPRKVRGGTGLHIGIGITLCFSYIMFNRVFEEFAKSGSMPVWLAVWMPNIIFAIIAVYLYRKAPK